MECGNLDVTPRTNTKKTCVLKRDQPIHSKYDKHCGSNAPHNWGELYNHLLNIGTFTLIMNKIFM